MVISWLVRVAVWLGVEELNQFQCLSKLLFRGSGIAARGEHTSQESEVVIADVLFDIVQ